VTESDTWVAPPRGGGSHVEDSDDTIPRDGSATSASAAGLRIDWVWLSAGFTGSTARTSVVPEEVNDELRAAEDGKHAGTIYRTRFPWPPDGATHFVCAPMEIERGRLGASAHKGDLPKLGHRDRPRD
jgi:hypothetical protein